MYASATSSNPTVVRCSSPAPNAPGVRGTPNHSATYGVEHATSATTAIPLQTSTARRTFSGQSRPFAHRAKHSPMIAIVLNAQNAA
ncbi:hypothetical protein LO763_18055 [Glycomyces sp. A-F 0318]|nr:hypothetical protein [Glycomyces amatae]MCD0445520.1 hypothetical protein [Glycomyces amatae]